MDPRAALAWLSACVTLAGCVTPLPATIAPPAPPDPARLAEPAPDEIVVVINDNAMGGTHAGLFAGALLSDPAGSYVKTRSADPAWRDPTLADYVRFQLEDGERVLLYRFRLGAADAALIAQRIRDADETAPLFCAAAVQNQIAGVGPFAGITRIWWTSPSALSELLRPLANGVRAAGLCQTAAGLTC